MPLRDVGLQRLDRKTQHSRSNNAVQNRLPSASLRQQIDAEQESQRSKSRDIAQGVFHTHPITRCPGRLQEGFVGNQEIFRYLQVRSGNYLAVDVRARPLVKCITRGGCIRRKIAPRISIQGLKSPSTSVGVSCLESIARPPISPCHGS